MFLQREVLAPAALALFLTPFCISAQTSPDSEEAVTGTISGSVVNESGQPMPGATVSIRQVNVVTTGRSTVTDSEGAFRVTGLSPALYFVSAYLPAYVTPPADDDTPTSYYRIGDSVRLELIRGGVITGTVTNAAGEPVIGVRVRAQMVRDAKGEVPKRPPFAGPGRPTDDRGVYRLFGLMPGTYLVSAGGTGAVESQFNPYNSDGPTYAPSGTRDNAGEVSIRSGEESNADIRYRGESGHIISGTVKLTGTSGASIVLIPAGPTVGPTGNTFQAPGGRGFAFDGLADGDYELVAQEMTSPQNSLTPSFSVSEAQRVTVKGADVTGIELFPRPLATINGRIVLEPSKAPQCQGKRRPSFSEMVVELRRPEKDEGKESKWLLRPLSAPVSPDPKGSFVLRNVWPGRYQFDSRFYARYWYLDSINITSANAKIDAAAKWTSVKSGELLANLTITLAEGAASIRGRVAAAPGVTLYLVPAEREKTTDVLRFFAVPIAADGTFALNNVPPGRYWSLAQTPVDPQVATTVKLRAPEAAELREKLRRTAEGLKVEIELKPCQNLVDHQLKN